MTEELVSVTATINGRSVTDSVPARLHVVDFLRARLGLTGTHIGCEQGACGMCTVIVDGEAVKGCLMLACQLDGRNVQTVESMSTDTELSALQRAFRDSHALQCGFCTPGFLMTATALSYQGEQPDRDRIRDEIAGVLCRCTGYENVVTAIESWFAENSETSPDDKAAQS